MDKKQFLEELRQRLSGLPQNDIEERLAFYAEMIDDRAEEGMSEEEAVAEIGSAEAIAREAATLELSTSAVFMEKYVDGMMFGEG